MKGRPASIYIPGPRCKNGHKRTAKNTQWVRQRHKRGKYVYVIARCALCRAEANNGA